MKLSQRYVSRVHRFVFAAQAIAFAGQALTTSGASALTVSENAPQTSYLRLVFSAEGHPLVTTGCLSVRDRSYPAVSWWSQRTSSVPDSGAEHALRQVIAAFVTKDRDALAQLADPASGDTVSFERRAAAYFQQFSQLTINSISRSIQINDWVVFFLVVETNGTTSEAPLIFKRTNSETFRFQSDPPQSVEMLLALDWIRAAPSSPANIISCTPENVGRTDVHVPLTKSATSDTEDRSYMYLKGHDIAGRAKQSDATGLVLAAFDNLKKVLSVYQGSSSLAELNDLGAQRLHQWWSTADSRERQNYVKAIISEQPFFIFDLDPLYVLFTSSGTGTPHVFYFIPGGSSFIWTNSSYGSTFDWFFKAGPLYQAADPAHPFRMWFKTNQDTGAKQTDGSENRGNVSVTK